MDATSAARQRRYRAHKRGDHSLCDPARCSPDSVTPSPVTVVTRNSAIATPAGLGTRGRRLWRDVVAEGEPGPAAQVLLEEACRIADRLDRLDAVLSGDRDAWMRFHVSDDGAEVTVVVDKPLSEARQQAVALRQLVAELRQGTAEKPSGQEGSIVDQLAARRAARLADAAGS